MPSVHGWLAGDRRGWSGELLKEVLRRLAGLGSDGEARRVQEVYPV